MNLKLRLKNKTTLLAILTMVVTIGYTVLSIFGIVPKIAAEQWKELAALVVEFLVMLGVVVDPTTEGIGDSKRAMTYCKPKKDKK